MDKSTKLSQQLINKLRQSDFIFKDEKGHFIDVPKSGNLALLAIGYKGLIAVRKKRNQFKTSK